MTADKCVGTNPAVAPFNAMIVDEAFQLADHKFHAVASLAQRWVLVSDPGQIVPVVQSDVYRWQGREDSPHILCPTVIMTRFPAVKPVSRRLTPDTVRFVQPAFYPEHPFATTAGIDAAIQQVTTGHSLVGLEQSGTTPQDIDLELVERMTQTVERGTPPADAIDEVYLKMTQHSTQHSLPATCSPKMTAQEQATMPDGDGVRGRPREALLVGGPDGWCIRGHPNRFSDCPR